MTTTNSEIFQRTNGFLDAIRKDAILDIPAFELVHITKTFLTIDNDSSAFLGKVGWARYQKKVVMIEELRSFTEVEIKNLGAVLNAEWVENHSYFRAFPNRISPNQLAQVQVTENMDGNGDAYLRQIVTIVGDGTVEHRRLNYHLFWGAGNDGMIARDFDAFVGFEDRDLD